MRKLSVILGIVLLASMLLPQVSLADSGKQGDVFSLAVGVPVAVDNNVDVTYTGKHSTDKEGNTKYEYVARIQGAPIYNDDGTPVDCSWHGSQDAYVIVNNVFSAQVIGAYITTTYQGQSMSWNPVVLVDSKEYAAKSSPKVLAIDPINENYRNNTLEWDYGVCVRRVRVIEGLIQETWIFASDPKGTVWIKDNAQKSAGFTWAIAPYAYDADNNPILINEYKQVAAKDLAGATYPVVIDPTEVYVTSASDGDIYASGAVYATTQASASGTVEGTAQYIYIGQIKPSAYTIQRGYLYFDTSALPDSATLTSVNVSLYGYLDQSTSDFNVTIQSGMPTYPHDPLVVGDFDKTHYAGDGGSKNTSTIAINVFNNISMNATGMSWISLIGTTKFCLRSSKDIAISAPTGNERFVFYSYEKGAGYRPTLYVTYSSSGVPTVTTNPASYVTKTTAQLNGYVTADGGEADTVSFNYHPWYNQNWSDCIEFTINASYVDANLTNFPVLVTGSQLNTTDPDFWTTVNVNGSDILFTSSNGVTKLNRELVSINTTAQTMECYVNVTSIDATTDTKFYMYYGANVSLHNESNSTGTWDANYVFVFHCNDLNTSAIDDSTVNDLKAIKSAANQPIASTSGLFSGDIAQMYDAYGDYMTVANNAVLNVSTGFTMDISLFVPTTTNTTSFSIYGRGNSVANYVRTWQFWQFRSFHPAQVDTSWSTSGLNDSVWHIWADTFDSSLGSLNKKIYKDSTYRTGTTCTSSISTSTSAMQFAQWGTLPFNGSVSEIRESNIGRSAAYVDATYHTLYTPTSFAPVTDVFTTTATQSKNTGDSFYISQTGLTANTLYGYKAEAVNSYGTSWGAWRFFNTTVTLGNVSNLAAYPSSTSIELIWTKGNYSSNTLIRYKIGSFPTTTADGNYVTLTPDNSYVHTGLTPGTTYYYSAWAEDAGTYSTGYDTAFTTTLAGGGATATPNAPDMPDTWFSGTNTSRIDDLPFYEIVTDIGAAGDIPATTWWFMILLGGVMTGGLLVYSRSKNLFIACILVMVLLTVLSIMMLMPMWIVYAFAIASMGLSWKDLR